MPNPNREPEPERGTEASQSPDQKNNHVEEALRVSEEHFRQLVAGVQDYAIFLLDSQGRIASWNAGAQRIKGYAAEEIIGKHFSCFYTPEANTAGWPEQELRRAAAEGRFEDESWRVRKDGSRFWANVVITALRNEDGSLRGFLKITRDLTERKQAEENARRLLQEQAARKAAEEAERQVRTSEEWLRVTLASIGDAVIATDTGGRVKFINPVAQSLTGWAPEEAEGQPLERVFPILHEETRLPVEHPVAKVIREGVVVGLGNHTALVARDGTEKPIEDSAAPITDAEGNVQGVVLVFRDVTEKRRSLRAMRESEARKAAILETALDCIVTINHEGKIVDFNPAAEKTFGFSRAEAIGQPMAELLVPPALRERHYRGLARCLATGEGPILNQRIEMPALRADGTEFPVELAITRISTEGPPLFSAYVRDVTDLKRTERRRNARLAVTQILAEATTVQEAAPGIVRAVCESLEWDAGALWSVDRQANLLRCEETWHQPSVRVEEFERACRQRTFEPGMGLPGRVWASGQPSWLLDVSKDLNFPRAVVALQEGLFSAFACPIFHGREVLGVIEFFSQHIREPDPDLLEMMGTIGGQIGQFMVRRQAVQALRAAREQLHLVTDTMSAPVTRCSRDLTYLWVSKPYADWLGRSPEEIVGRPIPEVIGLEAFEALRPYFERVLSGQEVRYEEEVNFRGAGRRWVHAVYTPTFDAAGVPDGWVAVVLDIDDRKRAEEAVKEADRRKDEFLAMLSHELRNPLAPIRNALHVLKMPEAHATAVRKAREMMERQLHHLVRLVDDLLDVSRIIRGKVELQRERIDLATVFERAIETAQPLIDARGHELTVALPSHPLWIEGDPIRLAQVVGNLLSNAAKFMDKPGPIRLSGERDGGAVVIRVRDAGTGIAPELLPRVFDLFVQADNSLARTQGGLGIGLTLVKHLVEMHGGSVTASSPGPGQGSEFIIRLPALLESRSSEGIGLGESGPTPARPSRRVLVVDDNVDAAESAAMLLRMWGHLVQTAYNGPAALEAERAFQPEVVLLDIGLPGMSGYQVAEQLRSRPESRALVLVALTGYGQEEDRRRAREAGFNYHLTKPPDPGILEALLASPYSFSMTSA
jgi:PAS domain S-box-containing protein